jgi:type I restriction enzyme S subunit
MSSPAYPTYKNSGVEWLGEVPEHWTVIALKWLSPVFRGASPRPIDDPIYFDDKGEFGWVRIADVTACPDGYLYETTQKLSDLGSSLSVKLEPGELFLSIAGSVGKPCITAIKACIHDGFVYFPWLSIDQRLLYRVFESGLCFGGLGKMGTQLNLNTDTVGGICIAVPPAAELSTALAFLDHETVRIDALIEEQQRLIELLKEKRQAVISYAVTKGLAPKVPMKHSGVEWLGEVPAHWTVTKLKFVIDQVVDCPHETPIYDPEGDFLIIRTADIDQGVLKPERMYRVDREQYNHRIRRMPLEKNDVVYSREGERWGHAALVPQGNLYALGQRMMQLRACDSMCPEFFMYQLNSVTTYRQGEVDTVGATAPHVNISTVINYCLTHPAMAEQKEISHYLNKTLNALDCLIGESLEMKGLLQERRSALISAAVTGKIDVRGWQPSASALSPESEEEAP